MGGIGHHSDLRGRAAGRALSEGGGTALMTAALVVLSATGCGGGSGGSEDQCAGWDCSGHGQCKVGYWGPACECDPGYQVSEDGKECIAGGPCEGQDCSGHGTCQIGQDGSAYCECHEGFGPGPDLTCLPGCKDDSDCTEPYEPRCTGQGKLATYVLPGKCEAGVCSYSVQETECGEFGCCKDHCCRLRPSNVDVVGWLEETGLEKSASGTFDTDSDCSAGSALGDCEAKENEATSGLCVCRLDSLTVRSTLRVTGKAGLVILAYKSVKIEGTLDVSGRGGQAGPGAAAFPLPEANTWYGGSGGSFGGKGGNVPEDGYEPRGDSSLIPLAGGQSGQDGCGGRKGGGGGGALQITAGEAIEVSGTINAGGGGGQGGNARTDAAEDKDCIGGAGGGSGGAVLLEAPAVSIRGTVAANGGGGGGGGNNDGEAGGAGADATLDSTQAAGGAGRDGHGCALQGNTEGGDGGKGAAGQTLEGGNGESYEWKQCPDHQNYLGGGGGGGGAGRIRVNSKTGCDCQGTCTPPVSCGVVIGG